MADMKVVHAHSVGIDSWKRIGGKWLMVKTVDLVSDAAMPKGT